MKIEYKMSVLATMMDSVQYYFYSFYMAILP
ncbi:putative membrane protein [Anoxybacillus sp. B7M1]|jgi:hypothetical protein|nr:putative membrane protein [Anoxybacillus sp. B2M1]ANB63391.1 putative membrane protein [Anoxybacillus sp. B7M1]